MPGNKFNETFEDATDYDQAPTSTNDSQGYLSPNKSTAGLQGNWGSECLEINNTTNDVCYARWYMGETITEYWLRWELEFPEFIGNGQLGMSKNGGSYVCAFRVTDNSGYKLQFYKAGLSSVGYSATLSTDTLYYVEFYGNSVTGAWEWRLNGVTQFSGMDGAVAFNNLRVGNEGQWGNYHAYYDNVSVSSEGWLGQEGGGGVTVTPSQLVAGGETMAPAVELLQQVAPARLIGGGSILAPTVAASGGDTFNEQFEATGYDESAAGIGSDWAESAGVGSIDEDQDTSVVVGAPTTWGSKCLKLDSAGGDTHITNTFDQEYGVGYLRIEFIVEQPPATGLSTIFSTEDAAFNQPLSFGFGNDGGSYYWSWSVDGGYAEEYGLALNTPYRVEFFYNAAGGWEIRLNGVTKDSGGSTTGNGFKYLYVGNSGGSKDVIVYYDNIGFSELDWLGAEQLVVSPTQLVSTIEILSPTLDAQAEVSVTAQVSQIVGGASIIGSVVSIVRTISFGVSQEGGGEVLVPSIDTGESITIDAAQMVSGVEVLSPTVSAQKTAVVSVAQQVSASEVLAPLVTARINVFSTQNAIIGGGEVIGSSAKAGVTASPDQVAAGGRMSEPMISIAGGIVPEPSEIEGGAEILTPSVIPGVSMFIEIAQILAGGETLTPSAGITKTVSQGQVVGGAEILVPAVTATKTISVTQNQIEAGADIVAPNVVTTKVVIVPITQIEVGGEILSVSPHVGIGITVSVDQVGAVGGMLSPDITTTRAIVVGQTQITAGGVLLAPATAGGVRTVKAGQIVSGGTALPPTVILIGEKIELSGSFASEVSLSGALK